MAGGLRLVDVDARRHGRRHGDGPRPHDGHGGAPVPRHVGGDDGGDDVPRGRADDPAVRPGGARQARSRAVVRTDCVLCRGVPCDLDGIRRPRVRCRILRRLHQPNQQQHEKADWNHGEAQCRRFLWRKGDPH